MTDVKHYLLMIAVVVLVGCASVSPEQKAIVEKAIRKSLKKPEGKLTKADVGKVTVLGLKGTKINDAGLKEVAKLQQLNKLDLSISKITDAGLTEVAKLKQLDHLTLTFTPITDAGLKEVAKMKQLKVLGLVDNKITKAGVAQLKKALPKCIILSIPKK